MPEEHKRPAALLTHPKAIAATRARCERAGWQTGLAGQMDGILAFHQRLTRTAADWRPNEPLTSG